MQEFEAVTEFKIGEHTCALLLSEGWPGPGYLAGLRLPDRSPRRVPPGTFDSPAEALVAAKELAQQILGSATR